jgi:alginate O-acetyltransferase complex protein AlgI
MLFNSMQFAVFLLLVLCGYYLGPRRLRMPLLLVAGAVFYMWWNPWYITLLLFSSGVDWACALALGRATDARKRALFVGISVTSNLGLLAVFKYWSFAHQSLAAAAAWLGYVYTPPELNLLLPVGISFYTFQAMSYVIDVSRGEIEPERRFDWFLTFILFFPQLVAGPIERAGNLMRQLHADHEFDVARITTGLQLVLWGLFKKVVIADRIAIYTDAVYGRVELHSGPTLLLATYAFAIQIYADFSAYSDIAIGTARMFGVDLMRNFERPYFSTCIRDFWRRWHISLSTWLRDYLYVPLGGNRGGSWFTYRNLMITMVLGGLWHGASWNFVIWGGLQGAMLSYSRATLDRRDAWLARWQVPPALRDGFRIVATFHLVCLSWVFFRANTLGDALTVLGRVATDRGAVFLDAPTVAQAALGVAVVFAVEAWEEWGGRVRPLYERAPVGVRWGIAYAGVAAVILLGVQGGGQFIYFQF